MDAFPDRTDEIAMRINNTVCICSAEIALPIAHSLEAWNLRDLSGGYLR